MHVDKLAVAWLGFVLNGHIYRPPLLHARFFQSCAPATSTLAGPSSSPPPSDQLVPASPRLSQSDQPSLSPPRLPAAEDAWVPPNPRATFFRSLAPQALPQQPVDEKPSPGVSEVLQDVVTEELICDFSLEALLRFKNDHFEHVAHETAPKSSRRRPNYDNRKRRFLAIQPPDRNRYLYFD